MKVLTNLNLANLKQNRARTIMTIIGIALSVALILSLIGLATSLIQTIRVENLNEYGDYHLSYLNVPGDKVEIIERSDLFTVVWYSNEIGCIDTDYGYKDCYVFNGYPVDSYEPITDASEIIRDSEHLYNVFLKFKNPARATQSERYLSNELEDAGVSEVGTRKNFTIAMLDGDMPETTKIFAFSAAAVGIGVLIIVAAFIIRNSFNISITERVRQFGMLASVGARPRQIRRMVYGEGFLIGLVAIPLGILLGCGATFSVVALGNHMLDYILNTPMLFYIPLEAFILIIFVGLLIILLSTASPAIVASRVSPIAALRNVQDIKVKPRKVRTSKISKKVLGIGGVLALKNLKRSRQKYRTTVISIVVSVVVFIAVSSFMSYGHKIINLVFDDTGANYVIGEAPVELYNEVAEKFDLKEYAYNLNVPISIDGAYDYEHYTRIVVVSRDEFARYARRASPSASDYDNLAILQDNYLTHHDNGSIIYKRSTDYNVNDEISFRAHGYVWIEETNKNLSDDSTDELVEDTPRLIREKFSDLQTIKISIITDEPPLGWSSTTHDPGGVLFISEDHPVAIAIKDYLYPDQMYIADSGLGDKLDEYFANQANYNMYKDIDGNAVTHVEYSNIEMMMQVVRNMILMFEIVTYSFIIIVSLIGATNIFNTITTNIALRAKEFAVLKSVGMTNKEFNRMIRFESTMYTTRALLIGLPIGLLISYGVSRLFEEAAINLGWIIPWSAIIISIVAVAVLIAGIMRYSVRKIKKQNIIETIRKESF